MICTEVCAKMELRREKNQSQQQRTHLKFAYFRGHLIDRSGSLPYLDSVDCTPSCLPTGLLIRRNAASGDSRFPNFCPTFTFRRPSFLSYNRSSTERGLLVGCPPQS